MDKDKFELYKIAIEEYRFQVRYNWERNRFYLTLSAGIVSVAASLLRLPGSQDFEFLLIPLFIIGAVIAFIGLQTLTKGHEYYRRTILKMTQLATDLGLSAIEQPIASTEGQREAKFKLNSADEFVDRPFRIGTINYYLAILFTFAIAANAIGGILVFVDRFN